MDKRLYRSNTNKVISGVCGGLGEYFGVDPILVRVVAVVLVLATGVAVVAYIAAWIIVPRREFQADTVTAQAAPQKYDSSWRKYLPGLILIGLGAILLIRENWYWFDWSEFWPVVLILAGLALIFGRGRRSQERAAAESGANHGLDTPNGGITP